MLEINNISKQYNNGVQALNNISLSVKTGMFGLLGPNGAGKSSLMRTIAGLQLADTGSIIFNGIDVSSQPEELKKVLGYLPQEFGVYPRVTAYELLDYLAVLKGITNKRQRKEQVLALLAKTNLYSHKNNYVATFSGGMKRRFGIAQALLGDPNLIMVDEPTAGLDPEERNRFYNLLSKIGERTVLILSTHIVEDIQQLCTDMAIINKGQVLIQGAPNHLIAQIDGRIWSKTFNDDGELEPHKADLLSTKTLGSKKLAYLYSDTPPATDFSKVEPTLEDVYFHALKNLECANSHGK